MIVALIVAAGAATLAAAYLAQIDVQWCGSVIDPSENPWPSRAACGSRRAEYGMWVCLLAIAALLSAAGAWHVHARGEEIPLRRLARMYRSGRITLDEYHELRNAVLDAYDSEARCRP